MKIGDLSITSFIVGEDQAEKLCLASETVWERDYSLWPLTFAISSGGTIRWSHNQTVLSDIGNKTIEYRKNKGTWTSITASTGGVSFNVATGDIVEFRGNNVAYSSLPLSYNTFSGSTAQFEAYGNVMSLISGSGFETLSALTEQYALNRLFAGTKITSAKNLILPSLTLPYHVYTSMFENCSMMTTAPVLPAPTLSNSCYDEMFKNCSSLNYIKCLATNISATNCTYNWVTGVAPTGTFVEATGMSGWSAGNSGIPNGWTVEGGAPPVPEEEPVYSAMPLTFEITTAPSPSYIYLTRHGSMADKTIEYSKDDGTTWTPITSSTAGTAIEVAAGNKVQLRGSNSAYGTSGTTDYCNFTCSTGVTCKVYGNLLSIHNMYAYELIGEFHTPYLFKMLFFNNVAITDAGNLIMNPTILSTHACNRMFFGCTALTQAPALPATKLEALCYEEMFGRCTSLTHGPDLPATIIPTGAYSAMFDRSGLVEIPAMSATTLSGNNAMATMFLSCTSLTAVTLPETITNLGNSSAVFQNMFRGCSNLSYIKCTVAQGLAEVRLKDWVLGVAANGTFVKRTGANWPSGTSGIPTGWTVQTVN